VHEGDVVTVEGKIMHELKVSALTARDCYYIAQVAQGTIQFGGVWLTLYCGLKSISTS